jgi:hypothetical protein
MCATLTARRQRIRRFMFVLLSQCVTTKWSDKSAEPAAQADALLSAAAFLEQAGITELTIAVAGDQITILVPRTLPPAAASPRSPPWPP